MSGGDKYFILKMPCGFQIEGDERKCALVDKIHRKKCERCSVAKKPKLRDEKEYIGGVWKSRNNNIIKK